MTNSRLVYSTNGGNICPSCHKSLHKCNCRNQPISTTNPDGVIRVQRHTKGRKGSEVTIIEGFTIDTAELKTLAKEIKIYCGTGGTVKPGIVEIQGDKRREIKTFFNQLGIPVKILEN